MKKSKKHFKKSTIFKGLVLAGYILCVGVLIFESCMNGSNSANQSNEVGGSIAGIVNNFAGDRTTFVLTTGVTLEKPTTEVHVGDNYQLIASVAPKDATHQGLTYSSNKPHIANVDSSGLVTFFKSGEVTLTATSSKYSDISDSITFDVKDIHAERIESSINGVNKDSNDVYTLTVNHSYSISTTFYPEATSIRSLSYSINNNQYLSVNSIGQIQVSKHSFDEITELTVSCEEITTVLKIKTELSNITVPSEINTDVDSISLYATQSKSFSYYFAPSNTTFQTVNIKSDDTKIATVSGKKVKGVKEGTTNIVITSTLYPEISKSIAIEVLAQPSLTDFTLSLQQQILVGNSATAIISKVQPAFASTSGATYTSSDSTIATVSTRGVVKGVAAGTVEISVTINGITKTVSTTIKVNDTPVEDKITSFTVDGPNSIECNTDVDLTESIRVTSFSPFIPENKNITFSLVDSPNATLSGNILTVSKPSHVTLHIVHTQSQISVNYEFVALMKPQLTYDKADFHSFNVGDTNTVTLNGDDEGLQTFIADIRSGSDNVVINQVDNSFVIKAVQKGDVDIDFYSVFDGKTYLNISTGMSFLITHVFTKQLNLRLTDSDNKYIELVDNKVNMNINETFNLSATIDAESTLSLLEYESLNPDIVKISASGVIKPIRNGEAKVRVREKYSTLSETITITIYNIIEIAEGGFTLKGKEVKYSEENNLYTITNGYNVKLNTLFTDNSTYKHADYVSSDETILTVSPDGTITPLKAGDATVTIIVDDEMIDPITLTINFHVKKQSLITNMSTFLLFVRKALGHFGAFLVLGIFSTLVAILFFRRKGYIMSLPLNFAQGFGIAALTEYIQTFVPGRSGVFSDVIIDFTGFLCSSVSMTVGFLVYLLIKYVKSKKKAKPTDTTNLE